MANALGGTMQLRLDKYLADLSVDTRSKVKLLIRKGRVRVNNAIAKKPETKIDTETDTVTVDGRKLVYHPFEYYMLNKPAGVLSAARDKKQPTVLDLIESDRKDLFPVGRLDKDTVGLLLICNDGQLSHHLLSPSHHVDKTYEVRLDGMLTEDDIAALEAGVDIGDDEITLPASVEAVYEDLSHVNITIHEGRFHQVKRMFLTRGMTVTFLKRLSMGSLVLDPALSEGEYRPLTEAEIQQLSAFGGTK